MLLLLTLSSLLSVGAVAQTSPVPVVGLKTGISPAGQRPARPNIVTVYSEQGPYWDLYIQALDRFQKVAETDERSYFQIAGIHGLPFAQWNGVGQADGAPFTGFCTHGEVLFPAWHRPYVALFEQTLASHVQDIANQYNANDQPAYQAAAQTFRIPFWDWASDYNLPQAATSPNTTVRAPNGTTISMPNPLFSYHFQQVPQQGPGFGGFLDQFPVTKRWPDASGVDNQSMADRKLSTASLKQDVYRMFSQITVFEDMATVAWSGSSLEMPHNYVHDYVGGYFPTPNGGIDGTLTDLNWAGFDPVFWLHHCNVDRLFALWQAINYNDQMFNSTYKSGGQFATPPGTLISADSPLKPFFRDEDGNFWTSGAVTQLSTFGYAYPELVDDYEMSTTDLATHVTTLVNEMYAPSSPNARRAQSGPRGRYRRESGVQKDYSAEIVAERGEMDLPCKIQLTLNEKVVAQMTLLNMPRTGRAYTTASLSEVVAGARLSTSSTDAVVAFLKENLEVRIVKNGVSMPLSEAPSLQVQLQAQDFTPRRHDGEFPTFGNMTTFPLLESTTAAP